MLTKDDLIAIGQVVDQRLEKRLNDVLDERLSPIERDIKSMKRDMTKVQKDIRVMLAVLDRADVELRRRVERIEEHLGLTKPQ